MLTIFSTPKSFIGHIKVIQTNAIHSWVLLRPKCEVILFGDEEGTAKIASQLNIRHYVDVEHNEYGTPLVSSMFKLAQERASYNLMCFVNADIILLSDFLPAVKRIQKYPFLIVGQRWDLELNEPINFNDSRWELQVKTSIAKYGKLHEVRGMDYFVFPRGQYDDIPSFAIGRPAWDNWMVYQARSRKFAVIDATKAITAVHQNHDYAHHPKGKIGAFQGPEAEQNRKLLGRTENSFNINHATWVLTPQGLRRALSMQRLYRRLDAVPILVPRLRFLGIPKRVYIALYKAFCQFFCIDHD